jgi:uncharacterized protein YggU (UPF0235/DUF167 family)
MRKPAPLDVDLVSTLGNPFRVHVKPGARQDKVSLEHDETGALLAIRTVAAPENGRANAAILKLAAQALGKPPSALTIISGAASRVKRIGIKE